MNDLIRCKCNPLGPGPVGVAVDGNGRTTVCRECRGTGWLKPEPLPQVFACRQSDVREDQA